MGRLCALAIVLGAVLVQSSQTLPALAGLYVACLVAASVLVLLYVLPLSKHQKQPIWVKRVGLGVQRTTAILLALSFSLTWTTWRAEQRLNAMLSLEHFPPTPEWF